MCADVAQISDMMTEDTLKDVNKDEDAERKKKQKEGGKDAAGEEMERIAGDYIILLEETFGTDWGIRKE